MARGMIKRGLGTIIGNAGEYLVVGELLRRGLVAAPAPRNAPGFDVLVTNGRKSLNLRVKSKTNASDSWTWVVPKNAQENTVLKNILPWGDITVLVDLMDASRGEPPEYFIVPTVDIERRLTADFLEWLGEVPKSGKPHDPKNHMRRFKQSPQYHEWIQSYKNAWDRIVEPLNER